MSVGVGIMCLMLSLYLNIGWQVVIPSVALSLDGSLMTTAEVRIPEGGIGGFICLKFWDSELENKKFSLSTVVYEPHRFASGSFLKSQGKFISKVTIRPEELCSCDHNFIALVCILCWTQKILFPSLI